MVVRHMSISVSEEVEELIRAAAESAGMPVSMWLSEAAQRAAAEQAAIAPWRGVETASARWSPSGSPVRLGEQWPALRG
jgi:hypothetical protein